MWTRQRFFFFRALRCVSRVIFFTRNLRRRRRVWRGKKRGASVVAPPSPVVTAEQFFRSSQVDPRLPCSAPRSSSRRRVRRWSSPPRLPWSLSRSSSVRPRSLLPWTASRSKLLPVTMPPPTPSNRLCSVARQCLFCVNSCVRPLIFFILFNVVRRVIVPLSFVK